MVGLERFQFATAGRILFGPGSLRDFDPAAFGKRAFVITGGRGDRARPLHALLEHYRVQASSFTLSGEPTTDDVTAAVRHAREFSSDFVIGIGGGSVIDCGKATAALLTNTGDLSDYLEVIGKGMPIEHAPLPFIAIPTTAGAGAEATRNAVLASPLHKVKVSLRSPLMLPRLAIIDPELTLSLPPALTASTGMDALTQLIEPYVSTRANPMTDLLCIDGIPRIAKALKKAFCSPEDLRARTEMSLASLYGGMALANAGLGAVHGFAAAIGGMFTAPHGAVCATLLAPVMAANIEGVQTDDIRERYADVAKMLTGSSAASADDGIGFVKELCAALNVPGLGAYGIGESDLDEIWAKARNASSMKANPVELPNEVLRDILAEAL